MYEKFTSYLDVFGGNPVPEAELQKEIETFAKEWAQSEWMVPDAMEAMGQRAWASKSSLKNDAATMTAEEACVCLSAFIQQDSFIPGVLQDLIQQGVLPEILKRLKDLDS